MSSLAALAYRPTGLVLGVIDYVAEADGDPVPWAEVVDVFTTVDSPARTVEAALYDLQRFGALYRAGTPPHGKRLDSRTLRVTALGAAWRAGELLPCLDVGP